VPAPDLDDAVRREDDALAELGKMRCRCCRQVAELDRALTVWRNGQLVFGVCDGCTASQVIVIGTTERGIVVQRAQRALLPVAPRGG